jgi:hypothetical protein
MKMEDWYNLSAEVGNSFSGPYVPILEKKKRFTFIQRNALGKKSVVVVM